MPMATLFAVGPDAVFTNNVRESVDHQLTSDIAERTLDVINDALDYFDEDDEKGPNEIHGKRGPLSAKFRFYVMTIMLLSGLATASCVLWIRDVDKVLDCQETFDRCSRDASGSGCERLPLLEINDYIQSRTQACALSRGLRWQGMAIWRWLLFFVMLWPLHVIGRVTAHIIAIIVSTQALTGHALLFSVGLQRQLGRVFGAVIWMTTWFPLSNPARSWAANAEGWNAEARQLVWSPRFSSIHAIVWRALLIYVLHNVMDLVAAAIGKWLALQFHHKNHFERMQKALVHEHILQVLGQPQRLQRNASIKLGDHIISLAGFAPAHWQALRFVNSLTNDEHGILGQPSPCSKVQMDSIRQKARRLQLRLAKMLCEEQIAQGPRTSVVSATATGVDLREAVSLTPSLSLNGGVHEKGQCSGGGADHKAPFDLRSASSAAPKLQSELPEALLDAAGRAQLYRQTSSINNAVFQNMIFEEPVHSNNGAVNLESTVAPPASNLASDMPHPPSNSGCPDCVEPDSLITAASLTTPDAPAGWEAIRVSLRTARTTSMLSGLPIRPTWRRRQGEDNLAVEASEALQALNKPNTHFMKAVTASKTRRRGTRTDWMVQQLAAAKAEPTGKKLNVSQLQSYLMGNSYMKVLSFGSGQRQDEALCNLREGMHAPLQRVLMLLGMQKELKNKRSAWKLGYYLFWNLRSHGIAITLLDLEDVAYRSGLRHKDTARKLFDRNDDNFITLEEVITSVRQVYDNRKYLLRSLKDSHSVVEQVEKAIKVSLMVVLVFISIGIYDRNLVRDTWTAISAVLLSVTFIIGNSIREVFENAVYLFFTHAFDVGDIIKFEDNRYDVRSITLQYVALTRVDGADVTVPTKELRSARLHNMSRSGLLWEGVKFVVDQNTTTQNLEVCAGELQAAIKMHASLFGGEYALFFGKAMRTFKLEVACWFSYSHSGVDLTKMNYARMLVIEALVRGLTKEKVTFTLPPIRDQTLATMYPADEEEVKAEIQAGEMPDVAGVVQQQALAANMVLLS